ncbi:MULTISPECIES: RloB family protein [Pseudomonas]|uniref:RloB family protein n=1 Tax=Pseudomonas TaxID=286 RepID=UPI0009EB5D9A|nr:MULTISPECIES: RloB family protein [Pseudomonas]WHS52789.1 RloB family protein [Pseudomonas brassicacearum]
MARDAKSFERGKPKFKPQPKVLIICEDKKSSKTYLDEACLHFRAKVDVKIIHCGKTDPKGIVEEAVSNVKKYEKIFCAIDRDEHLNFDEAIRIAKPIAEIEVIASYPCFEYWLLLHFKYTRKPYRSTKRKSAGDQVVDDLRDENGMSQYAKGSITGLFSELHARSAGAHKNATRASIEAEQNKELNPSTMFHELLTYIESLSKPIKI